MRRSDTRTHTLAWSSTDNRYILSSLSSNLALNSFEPVADGELEWLQWLASQTSLKSLAFEGRSGNFKLTKEARSRGGGYWYAYFYTGHTTRKAYLGATNQLTFARLEKLAGELAMAKSIIKLPVSSTAANQTSLFPSLVPISKKEEQQPLSFNAPRRPIESQNLLVTKLFPPVLPDSLVPRARLLAELKTATLKPLTLVCATAGWGKTTLLAEWSSHSSQLIRVAWLSLDTLDNDLTLFWVSAISALRRVVPDLGETPLRMLRSAQPASPTAVLTALLNELAALDERAGPTPVILALDDYHLIVDSAIHESLVFLIEHLPANIRVVIASRFDPPFPLSRWRVRGMLVEIRAEELGFSLEETTFFLQNNGELYLSQEEISTLGNRTQGWVAGLQLAALSLGKQNQANKPLWIANFTGNNRYLLDYIEEEVLSRLPEAIQQFLLNTAVLNRLNAEVCQAVSGEANSQELLNTLERNNLFIIPLDDRRQWYRYHDLFREVLLARLQMKWPEMIGKLHTRAAEWYARHDEVREAIAHAFAASNFALAATLVEQEAKQFWLSGQQQAVFNWVELFPDEVLKQYALLALEAGRCLVNSLYATTQAVYVKVHAQVTQMLGRFEKIILQPDQEKGVVRTKAHLEAARPVIRRRIGLLRGLLEARTYLNNDDARGLKQLIDNVRGLGEDEDLNWRLVDLSLSFWLAESLERRGAILIPQLLKLKEQAVREGNNSGLIFIQNRLAFAYMGAGLAGRSAQECQEGLALLRQTGELSISEAYFHNFHSDFFLERYRLEEAGQELQETLRVAHLWRWVDLLVVGYIGVAAIELAQNNLTVADRALQQAEEIVQQEQITSHGFWVLGLRVRYWLANGELNRARQWAETIELSPETWHFNQVSVLLVQVQVLLNLGRYRRAVEILDTFSPILDPPTHAVSQTIPFLAIYFVALHLAGSTAHAQSVASRLFALTQPQENLWVYITGGELMRQALQSLLDSSKSGNNKYDTQPESSRSYVEGLIEAFERYQIPRKTSAISDSFSGSPTQGNETTVSLPYSPVVVADENSPIGSGEALSPQEQRVLRLLLGGQTYGEIAQELVVSPNTIKTQVSSIYRKLGVRRRSEVVELVRRRQPG